MALGLAVTAAALVATGTAAPREADRVRGHPPGPPTARSSPAPGGLPGGVHRARAVGTVTAPVRIADAATVRLLRPGDRVDVIAAEQTATGGTARVVARGARVADVPEHTEGAEGAGGAGGSGALVVLSVPRATAARLAGAGATAQLAVTLW